MLRETGALISLQPNAGKIVSAWGLDKYLENYDPMVDTAFRIFDVGGKLVRDIRLDTTKFGADRIVYHRQDLHTALKAAATDQYRLGKPVNIRVGCAVKTCDPVAGSVTLENGEVLHANIIVGADGIHSVLRNAVLDHEQSAIPTGISAYRMLLSSHLLGNVDVPTGVFDIAEPVTTMIVGHDRRIIMGPGRGGRVLGIVALVPDEHLKEGANRDSWTTEGSMTALLDAYQEFPQWIREIFQCSEDLALWQLHDIDPLTQWVRGCTILIGDAAHGMLPTQGQGASQSFEDAEALKAFLANLKENSPADEVEAALRRVFKVRYDRASLIQKYSREQARPGTNPGSNEIKLNPIQFMDYNCNYHGAEDWEARREI
jgi:salicylate hydroxylase